MSVLEVGSISGFVFDEEDAQRLTDENGLQRVELGKSDTFVYIYFNSVANSIVKFSSVKLLINLDWLRICLSQFEKLFTRKFFFTF